MEGEGKSGEKWKGRICWGRAWRPPCRGEKESCEGTRVEVEERNRMEVRYPREWTPQGEWTPPDCETALTTLRLELLGLGVRKRALEAVQHPDVRKR